MVIEKFRRWLDGGPGGDPLGEYPDARLQSLILFITERCNMRCEHCMFWQRIDDPGAEFSFEELEKIASSVPPLQTLALTGGEPFLRKDLNAIVETFFRDNQTHHIQVNTNGLLMDRMSELAELGFSKQYEKFLTFQVSIDGMEETHDRLRALPGSFKRIVRNVRELVEIQKRMPWFRVNVLTNINKVNYHQIEEVAELLCDDVGVEHAYDLVRGASFSTWGIPKSIVQHEDPRDWDLPPLEELDEVVARIRRIDEREGGKFAEMVRQAEVQAGLYQGQPAPFRCLSAGRSTGVVYSDGSVAACEFTTPFAKLQDFDFDLGQLWSGALAEKRRGEIQTCSCAHSCFVLTSMLEWEAQKGETCQTHRVPA